MAREPDVALFKIASGSMACKQLLAHFIQSITNRGIPPDKLSKVATDVVFNSQIARLAKLVSN